MNLRKLNEECEKVLNEISNNPEFRDEMGKIRSLQQKYADRDVEELKGYNNNDGYWDDQIKDAEAKASGKMDADYILKYLGDHTSMDIENGDVETLPTDGLTPADIRKKVKQYYEKGEECILAVPQGVHGWSGRQKRVLECYKCYYMEDSNGKLRFYMDPLRPWAGDKGHDSFEEPSYAGRTMMQLINSNELNRNGIEYIYLFHSDVDSLNAKRKERKDRKPDSSLERNRELAGQNTYDGNYDKSGYLIDTKALKARLDKYKIEKGAPNQKIDDTIALYDQRLAEYKEMVVDIDPRKGNATAAERLYNNIKNAATYLYYTEQALKNNDLDDVNRYLDKANEALK